MRGRLLKETSWVDFFSEKHFIIFVVFIEKIERMNDAVMQVVLY